MQRVTAQLVAGLVAAVLSLLTEQCRADGGALILAERVIWAVNCGGESHVDVHGIHFKTDPLEGKLGKASDYGMRLPILRSSADDQILYQTERYNEDTFGYDIPIREEGDYILVMKYAEVYFAQSQQKVFDVRLNGHVVVKDLDIFERVGHSTAHDEIVSFSIRRGKLSVQGEVSTFNGKLTVEFVKGYYDNPKVCALYVMKGTLEDVPKLQPHPGLEKPEEEEEEEEESEAGEEVQSHEGWCMREVNTARFTGDPRCSLAAAQDQAQVQSRQRAGHPIPPHISVLQSPRSRPFSWWVLPGREHRPPHVLQAGTTSCTTSRLFQTVEQE